MTTFKFNQTSKRYLPLDPHFYPMALNHRAFEQAVLASKHPVKIKIGIERELNQIYVYDTMIFHDEENQFDANARFVERLIKTLLWSKGGYKIYIAAPREIQMYIKSMYAIDGMRSFDVDFMSKVYGKPFEVKSVDVARFPKPYEMTKAIGRHLEGCRIGFDAGGSDRKVSAVIDGETVFSEEVVWHPKLMADPDYHIQGIKESIEHAKAHLPRVDGIGVSAAGVYIDNEVKVASLFIKVPEDAFEQKVKTLFKDLAKAFGDIPLEVANDGDVTALAGAMSMQVTSVLGIAMGTSEAAGYVNDKGHITGWLNELAFVPIDYHEHAMEDEWSHDIGCGVKYFSQDAIIKLAVASGISFDENLSPAEKLKVVQKMMEDHDPKAIEIYETMGVYLGYGVAYYALFYEMKHVLVLGRVLSGKGGELMVQRANELMKSEFPELAKHIRIELPDEKSRRVGQSIAAASLPELKK
jgi:predicted NBD/HSP70 family sugar kinase